VSWLQTEILGNPLQRWLLAILAAAAVMVLSALLRIVAIRRLRGLIGRNTSALDDVLFSIVDATRPRLLIIPAVAIGAILLSLPELVRVALNLAALFSIVLQGAIWSNRAIDTWVEHDRRRLLASDAGRAGALRIVGFVIKVAIFAILLIIAIDSIPGVEVTALVAGLGIGGIAVALAVQTVLSDLLASLAITLDRPFVLGDAIGVDDLSGTVESIGLKTTRLRSTSGEQLVFSNADLLSSRIKNFQRLEQRRVVLSFGLAYGTTAEQLRAAPAIVRAAVEIHEQARFDRAHFARFEPTALAFEAIYFVTSADYALFMDIQQAVNLAVIERFAEAGISFAFQAELAAMADDDDPRARKRRDGRGISPEAG
jgi:small-conductance mechanosensitive channel